MGSAGVHTSLGRREFMISIWRNTGNVCGHRVQRTRAFGVALLAILAWLLPGLANAQTPSISSEGNQTFTAGDPATLISAITIIDDAVTPTITGGKDGKDIRIRIPSTFNMTWDTSITTVSLSGPAASKVKTTLKNYQDGGRTLVLDVDQNFAAGDQVTIEDPQFTNFSAASAADNLELEVNNDNVVSATDDKTITIDPNPALSISSAANQTFTAGDPATLISTITITDHLVTPTITDGNDLRIRIPSTFNMTWDTSITTVTLGGPQAGKVSTTLLAYEDGDRTLVLNVTSDFAAGDQVTVEDPQFTSIGPASAADSLELEVNDDDVVSATDDKTITIDPNLALSIFSAANQAFLVGDPATLISTITITDDAVTPTITGGKGGKEIRIRIPATFNMTWDSSIDTVSIGGPAASKMKTKLKKYEDGDRTLVVDVDVDFVAGDQITIAGVKFANFSAPSAADNLELEVNNDDVVSATDYKTITIDPAATPKILSAADQMFNRDAPATAISTITVSDATTPTITLSNDIRIRIPSTFNMTWDSGDLTATIGGNASGKVSTTMSYEDGGKTLVLDVTSDFAGGDYVTVSDLSFANFTAISAVDNLELEVNNDDVVSATDGKTITIIDRYGISSEDHQAFLVGDPATFISTITITDDAVTKSIKKKNDIRIRIPSSFNMTWDTSTTSVSLGGPAASKVSTTLMAYEDGNRTLVLDVTTDFAAGDHITIEDPQFTSFSADSAADNLELEINDDDVVSATDDKTITITTFVPAVTSTVAEISPNDVQTSSLANAFSYDIGVTIGGGDTGVDRVAITAPGSFGPPAVSSVLVDGLAVAYTDNTSGNDISVDLTTKVTASSQITVLFSADAPTTEDLTGVDFVSTVDDSGNADAAQSTTEGNGDGDAGDANSWAVTTTDPILAVTAALAEISPNDVITSSTGNAFSYDIQATIDPGDTGVDRVAITVPGTFGAPTVTAVQVDGIGVAYTDNTAGNAISVDLTTKVTASSKITVLFNANAPATQDLTGVNFLSTVDDSGNVDFSNGYTNRVEVDFVDAEVSGGPHTNFPVLISSTLLDLRTVGNGGKVEDANGYDIIFTSDAAGTIQLAHEIESYVSSTGEIGFWVRVESLAATTKIYMFYGNSGIATFQGDVTSNGVTGVWDNDYVGVYHLEEAGGTHDDSAGSNDGTRNGNVLAAGKIAGGQLFDGDNDYVDLPDGSHDFSGAFSVSLWAKWDDISGLQNLIGKDQDGLNFAFVLIKNPSGELRLLTKLAGTQKSSTPHPATFSNDIWYHIIAVMESNDDVTLYVNAADPTTSAMTGRNDLGDFRIGETPDPYWNSINGTIDEVRISDTARDAQWIQTEFNNQDSPATFYALGSPATDAGPGEPAQSTTEGNGDGDAGDANSWAVTTSDPLAATTTLAEISPNNVDTSSTGNAFSYDVQANIGGSDTGVDRVAIAVPATFGAPTVTGVQVDGVGVAYTDNTAGNAISVDLTTKLTASSKITVLFNVDAPTVQDLTGANFLSTVDDSGTGVAAQPNTVGNGDGDAGDANSWAVTTGGAACDIDPDGTYIEAEHYVPPLVGGSGPGTFLTLSSEAGYNGSGYLFSNNGSTTTPPENERADYTVNFTTTGTYYVWMRGYGLAGSESLFIGLDGTWVGALDEGGTYNAWLWSDSVQSGVRTINVATTGNHTINLWGREASHNVDGIYITTDSGAIPGGTSIGIPTGARLVNPNDCATAVTAAVAEISPNDVTTSSTGNAFSYDIQATIGGNDTGVGEVTITVPANFGAPTVTGVQVGGVGVAYTDNTAGNAISIDLTTKVTSSSKITVLFSADAPTAQDLTGVNFVSTVADSVTTYAAQPTTEGNGDGDAGDANSWAVTTTDRPAVTSAAAEISPNDVGTTSTGNVFSYDIQATISGGDTGVNRVAITVPGTFGAPTVTTVQVDGVGVAYTDNTAGYAISVDLTTKVTASSRITVLFAADAPATQDLTGVDFVSTVDDSGNVDVAQSTTEGNGDGDAGDLNSWTVTTTDVSSGGSCVIDDGTPSTGSTTGSSLTISHTTSGTERLMLVGVTINQGDHEQVNSVTWNGTSMSFVGQKHGHPDIRVEIWSLLAPETGTHDVVVTFDKDLQNSGSAGVVTFAGVDQTTPLGTFAKEKGSGTGPVTVDVPSASEELVFAVGASEDGALTVGAGQTQRWNTTSGTSPEIHHGAGSTEDGAASVTMSWTLGSSADYWAIGAVPIKPASTCGPAITSAVAEISPNSVATSSTANAFSYDIQATIGVDDSGVNRVAITVPGSFGAPAVTGVQVGGAGVAYTDNTAGNAISVDLTTRVTASSKITVLFSADAPATEDLTGVDFLSTVDDSGSAYPPHSTIEGNGDGDMADADSWAVTTWDTLGDITSAIAEISPNDVTTSSTANAFSYDIGVTIVGGNTGADRVAITVPGAFGAPTIMNVLVNGLSVAYTDNTSGNVISVDLATKMTVSGQITVVFNADAPTTQDLTGVNFLSTVDDSTSAEAAHVTTEGNGDADALDSNSWTVTTTGAASGNNPVTSAVAEISPNDVRTSSLSNAFSYDIALIIGGSNTGVNRVAITVPGSFGPGSVTGVEVDGVPIAYTDNTAGYEISVDLTTKVTVSSQITVLFSADAPTTEDLIGVDFLSTVDDSGNVDAAQSTTEGNGDGNAGDLNSWTVTTTDFDGSCVIPDGTPSTGSTTGSSITISHTTSGTDRLMLVGVTINQTGGHEKVASVTWNGTGLSLVGQKHHHPDLRVEIWSLVAPETGTHDVVVTFDKDLVSSGSAGVLTFTNVDQATPVGPFANAKGIGAGPVTVDVPSGQGELVFAVGGSEDGALTVGAGQTEHWNLTSGTSPEVHHGAVSTEDGAASVTMSWTLGSSADYWAIGAVSIKPKISCGGGGGSGGPAADHFAVIHDGNGINCQAEQVTIEAHDSDHTLATTFSGTIDLSTTTSRGDWSLVSGAGNLVNIGNGNGHYAMHPSDSSVVVLSLRNTFVETTNVDLQHSIWSEDAGEDDDLLFARAGFNFLAGGAMNTIGTQIGGKASNVSPGSQTLELQAVNTNDDTGACEAALVSATTVELAFRCENPSACTGRQVNISGTDIPDSDANAFLNYSSVSLDFGNSSDSTAGFTMSYPDVGQVQLHARYRFSPSGEWMLGASNEFVVRPFAFRVSAISNPGAVNPAGTVFTSAGTNFSADVSAMLWDAADDADNDGVADNHSDVNPGNNADLSDNLVALNFGREASAEQVSLTAALDQPAGGANPGLSGGTIIGTFSSGVGTTSTLRYDEVGIIEMSAALSDGDYLGIGTNETDNILGNSGYVGRFKPARYEVIESSIVPACAATFTYARQPFTGTMTIEAQAGAAAGNVRTSNYRAGFVTLDPASELVFINDQTSAAYDAETVTFNENFDSGTTGEADLALEFRWDMPQQAPAISTARNTAVTDEVTTLAAAPVSLGTNPTRYGRVNIGSAAGSELVNLGVPMRAEYYVDASTGFVTNTTDFCSSGAALSFTNFAENLDAGETCVEDSGSPGLSSAGCAIAGPVAQRYDDPLIAGEFNLFLEAPGAGNDGSTTVDVNVPDWLEFDWDTGVPGLEDPSGRITFGIYGGDKNQVYRRELY